jgi:hypothetical protein
MNAPGRKNLIVLCFLVSLIPFPAVAGEMYVWTDEQGATHITDHPPDKPAQIKDRAKYRDIGPLEAQKIKELEQLQWENFQRRKRHEQIMTELEVKLRTAQEEESDRKNSLIEKARINIEELEIRKKNCQNNENNARDESSRLFWKNEGRKIEHSIMDSRDFIKRTQ